MNGVALQIPLAAVRRWPQTYLADQVLDPVLRRFRKGRAIFGFALRGSHDSICTLASE
jgi:hypothetical protein